MRIPVTLAKSKIQGGEGFFIAQRHVSHAVQVNAFVSAGTMAIPSPHRRDDDGREFLDFSSYLRPKSGICTQTQYLPIKPMPDSRGYMMSGWPRRSLILIARFWREDDHWPSRLPGAPDTILRSVSLTAQVHPICEECRRRAFDNAGR